MDNLTLKRGSSDERRVFRAKRGDVKLALLDLVRENPRESAYRLMKLVEEKSAGVWKVSAGSAYPKLTELEEDGYITSDFRESTSLYSITSAGVDFITEKADDLKRIWNFNEEEDLGELEPVEAELQRVVEAIKVALNTDPSASDLIAQDLKALRKRIFGHLAEMG